MYPCNEQGRILSRYLRRWNFLSVHLHLSPSPATSTFVSEAHGSSSTIDHILCPAHLLSSFSECVVEDDAPLNMSDHLPILSRLKLCLTIPTDSSSTCSAENGAPPRPNRDKLSRAEIDELYTTPLEEAINTIPLRSPDDYVADPNLIDVHLAALTDAMKKVASDNLPHKRYASHVKPAWSNHLKVAQRRANSAYRQWRAAGRPRNEDNPLRASYKKAKGQFRTQLRAYRKEQREQFFASLNLHTSDSRKLFRDIRRANGHAAESSSHLSFNGTTYTGSNILTGWASHFSSLATPSSHDSFDPSFKSLVHCEFSHLVELPPGDHICLSLTEVEQAVRSLPPHKAAGPDGVEAEHLLYAGPLLIDHLRSLFNGILATCHIPASFLEGYVIPIPKGHNKDLSNPSNHRGISTLSNVSKVFEKLILELLAPVISINPLQGGFRPGYSCLHSAFVLQETIQSLRDQKKKAYVAFLDVSKAFDTVWHEGLLLKLHRKGVPHCLWHLIHNSYSKASSSVLHSGAHSHLPSPPGSAARSHSLATPLLHLCRRVTGHPVAIWVWSNGWRQLLRGTNVCR